MDVKAITGPIVGSVADLLDLRDSLKAAGPNASKPRLAFRGQPRQFGTLVPSFQRQFAKQSHGAASLIESRLIAAFREHYEALQDRSADMPAPEQIQEGYDLRCLSAMQHYEIPTRLLDWTSDYWTAVYFACASEPGAGAELWYYDRELFDRQRAADRTLQSLVLADRTPPREPPLLSMRGQNLIVELDPQLTPRMRNQFGHHTVSANAFADHVELLVELHRNLDPDGNQTLGLRRVLIEGACKSNTLQFLAQEMKLTASTIFPDVVGLGRFLRWQFDSLRTMYL